MKIYFNYKTIDAPWGGGNSFLRSLKKIIFETNDNIEIIENIENDFDIFFMNQLNRGPGRKRGESQFIMPWELARIKNYGHPSFFKMLQAILRNEKKEKKIVCRLTNLRSHAYNQKHHYRDFLLLWALKYTDFDIFQSEYIRNVFRDAGYKKTNNKVIHNGVNQELFNMSGKKFWDGSYPLKIFSNAFAIRESKRFDIIAEFSELTNVEVYHVGVWPENLNSRKVKLLGKMPQSDFVSLYKEEANVFLHPAEKDICPNAVLEAISCGLPVIYRNPGGTSEIVGNCGVEMKNSSKEALEEILAKFADCVENIKCRHSEFSIESSAKKYIEVFRKLLENNDLS